MTIMKLSSATESAADSLREQIILGEIRAGQRLNEVDLAKDLGISRPPLREAYRILENERLVEIRPRIGAFVTEISESDLEKIYAVRTMIELKAVEILSEKEGDSLKEIQQAVDDAQRFRISDPKDSKEVLRYWEVFAGFHEKMVESCGNYYLIRFYKVIGYNLARYQIMYLQIPGIAAISAEDHYKILGLVRNRRRETAKKNLKVHLDKTLAILKEHIHQKENIQAS